MSQSNTKGSVSRRDFLKLAAFGLAAAAAEAAGGGVLPRIAQAAPNRQTGALRVAWTGALSNLDPITASADVDIAFLNAVYDYLIDTDAQSGLIARLATSWETSEDGLTYTLQLAEGVKFHDGSDLTVDDVIWTFDRLRAEGASTAGLYSNVAAVEAGEGSSVVFRLTAPNPDFLYDLSDNRALILKANAENIGTEFNGTGPFRLQEYTLEERAVFTANAEYFGGAPGVETLEFVYFAEDQAAANALREGLVDAFVRVTDNATFLELSNDANFTAINIPTNQHEVARLRADRGAGADVRVQQAFKLALDRNAIWDRVQLGFGAVGRDTPIGPRYGAYYSEETPLPARDPEAARALLADAGFPDGLDITLTVPTVPERATLYAEALAAQLADAGIRVTIEPIEEGPYYDPATPNNWLEADFAITPWGDRPSPQFYLIESLKTDARWNESHFSDEELDTLIDQAGTTQDPEERAALYGEIQRILIERGPLLISYFTAQFAVTASSVTGINLHPFPGRTNFNGAAVG